MRVKQAYPDPVIVHHASGFEMREWGKRVDGVRTLFRLLHHTPVLCRPAEHIDGEWHVTVEAKR